MVEQPSTANNITSNGNTRQLPGSGSNKTRLAKNKKGETAQNKQIPLPGEFSKLKHRKSEEFDKDNKTQTPVAPASEMHTNNSMSQSPMIDGRAGKGGQQSFGDQLQMYEEGKKQQLSN